MARRHVVLGLAASLVLAACSGSTDAADTSIVDDQSVVDDAGEAPVDQSAFADSPGGSDASQTDADSAEAGGAPSTSGGAAPGSSSATSSGAGTGAGTSSGQGQSSNPTSGGGQASAALAEGPISIGIHFDTQVDAAFAAFGAGGAEGIGDIEQQVAAIVADINATGGLGGRTIEPVYLTSDPLQDTYETKAQQACARFTEDTQVELVVSSVRMPTTALIDCLSAAGTPLVWEYSFLLDDAKHASVPDFLYTPGHITADRMDFFVDAIAGQGYFDDAGPTGPVVGLLRFDTAGYERFRDKVVIPGLEELGLTLAEDFAYSPPQSASGAGDTAAQMNAAVLRFKTAGVTHLLFAPTGGVTQFLYGPIADSQDYRPRWGMTGMDGLNFLVGNVPPSQLEGAVAVGWIPRGDVAIEGGPTPSPAAQRCYDIIGTTGGDGPVLCDGLFFLQDALRSAGVGDVTPSFLRDAVEALGEGFSPVSARKARFGPGRHVGPALAQPLVYLTDCECFQYVGGLINIR